MYKLILLIAISSLAACSATSDGMKYANKSPRGISILNISKKEHAKAYRIAEKHCAKYYKVPRILKTTGQEESPGTTMVFECLKPSR